MPGPARRVFPLPPAARGCVIEAAFDPAPNPRRNGVPGFSVQIGSSTRMTSPTSTAGTSRSRRQDSHTWRGLPATAWLGMPRALSAGLMRRDRSLGTAETSLLGAFDPSHSALSLALLDWIDPVERHPACCICPPSRIRQADRVGRPIPTSRYRTPNLYRYTHDRRRRRSLADRDQARLPWRAIPAS